MYLGRNSQDDKFIEKLSFMVDVKSAAANPNKTSILTEVLF